jgi:hypothetical protein
MGSWSLAGNALATSPTGFLGTTDNNALVIKTGSPTAERLRIDTNGNVGIGTATPAATLDVAAGTLHVNEPANPTNITTAVQGAYLAWNALNGGTGETDFINNQGLGTGGFAFMNTPGSGSPRTTLMVITGGGSVGIGTATPASSLDVRSASRIASLYSTTNDNQWVEVGNTVTHMNLGIGATGPTAGVPYLWSASGNLMIGNDGGPTLFVQGMGNGNVGIATTNVQHKLEVNGTVAATGLYVGAGPSVFSSYEGVAIFGYNVGIGLTEQDQQTDGEPSSPLVVRGDIEVIGNGNVSVSGDVLLTGADCAEDFDATDNEPLEPGTVVVIDESGALTRSCQAYDRKVAGVVSGAGDYRHGILLDQHPGLEDRVPVALVGKVYCKVDADYSPVDVGDMLTTSMTPGHAMKAMELEKAFGSVIGKALRPLAGGKGMIPILIALQ